MCCLPSDIPRRMHFHTQRQISMQGDISGVCSNLQRTNCHSPSLGYKVVVSDWKLKFGQRTYLLSWNNQMGKTIIGKGRLKKVIFITLGSCTARHVSRTTCHVGCTMSYVSCTLKFQPHHTGRGGGSRYPGGGLLYMKNFYGLELLKNHFQTKFLLVFFKPYLSHIIIL